MISEDGLSAMRAKIAAELSRRPECFITHPTEVRLLQHLSVAELQDFAQQNGWQVVRRLGGRQLQFYNDTVARMLNETGSTPTGSPHSTPGH